ncbi:aminoglycoside phosphotransferase family protein [Amycolatopsis cihanbeyliensis]|uniref:Phosphotransferase family enzyme n=1 Tax=Amycolatopsis cihanbeyliensis TaxID=1128664 RepID=A0A542DRR6_AMYCI|nr:aminoglycoside phosphotransferase family protein [Amycolatopsis cihanbeyliensis]TQJ05696.1 phosphotransferase family enzyme [Amycolatopsis cihanbeyliensis]
MASAVAAAVAVGARFGLPVDAPEVLAERSNVLVRLGPVVARVPATTLLTRPDAAAWLARDVALAAFLSGRGAPVVPPSTDPPAGPHAADGLPVTLWRYVAHLTSYRPGPAEVASRLAELHECLRDYPGELPTEGPLAEIHRMLDLLTRELGPAAESLRERAHRLAETLPAERVQALHGDAHPGNLLGTAAGSRWIDFEDCWRGPLGWDLAALATTTRLDGAAALAAYPGAPEAGELAPFVELRRLFGVCWRFVIARRFPERLPEARAALAEYL